MLDRVTVYPGPLGVGVPSHTPQGADCIQPLQERCLPHAQGCGRHSLDARTWPHCRGHAEQVQSTCGVTKPGCTRGLSCWPHVAECPLVLVSNVTRPMVSLLTYKLILKV